MDNKHLKPLGPFLRVNTLELTCFAAVSRFKAWHNTAATVHDVMSLMDERPCSYTTIKTVLDRLTDKGFLYRKKAIAGTEFNHRSYCYTTTLTLQDVLAQMQAAIDEIVDSALDEVTKGTNP